MINNTIYLDNNATTKVDNIVVEEMIPFFSELYANPSSLSTQSNQIKKRIADCRKVIGDILNCNSEHIIFTSGGTESNNTVINSLSRESINKVFITSVIEHPSVLNTIKQQEKFGNTYKLLSVSESGIFNLSLLKNIIDKNTCLVSLMHVNNETGVVNNIEEISDLVSFYKKPLHIDAVQSFGKIKIDLSRLNIDFLSISSHKIHGPKGIGAVYVKNIDRFNKLIFEGNQENDHRAGTENVPGIIGFAKSVSMLDNFDFSKKEKLLRNFEKKIIDNIQDVTIASGNAERVYNTSCICFKNIEGESIVNWLNKYNISVSTGSACSSLSLEPSHVLKALKISPCYINGAVRFSINKNTTEDELDFTFEKVKSIVSHLRELSPF